MVQKYNFRFFTRGENAFSGWYRVDSAGRLTVD